MTFPHRAAPRRADIRSEERGAGVFPEQVRPPDVRGQHVDAIEADGRDADAAGADGRGSESAGRLLTSSPRNAGRGSKPSELS